MPVPDRNLWATPGGMVEAGEDLDIAGARELDEETGLTVDPDDLVLFDARTLVKFEATHKTSRCYAVDAGDAAGTPAALDEINEARYWTVEEFRNSPATLGDGTNVPEAHVTCRGGSRRGGRRSNGRSNRPVVTYRPFPDDR